MPLMPEGIARLLSFGDILGRALGIASTACHPSRTGNSSSSIWALKTMEVEIVANFGSASSGLTFVCHVPRREIRPPTPRSEATVYAVTRGNIAELAATAFVALLLVLLSIRTIGYRGEQCNGGESVSQSTLRDKAFSTFIDQNPPFELRPEIGSRRGISLFG